MNNQIQIMMCLLSFTITLSSCGQSTFQNVPLYYTTSETNEFLDKKMELTGFQKAEIIYIQDTDKKQTSKEEVINEVKIRFPNKNDTGMLVLDWEGHLTPILKKSNTNSKEFTTTLSQMVKLVQLLKKDRPQLLIGYYGIPFRIHKKDSKTTERYQSFAPLFKEVDILFPSIYYINTKYGLESYIENSLLLALSLGKQFNKPVMPFVWHRHHPRVKNKGFQYLALNDYEKILQTIKKTQLNGKQVDGIVWWTSDHRLSLNRNKAIIKDLNSRKGNLDSLLNQNIDSYGKTLIKIFNEDH